MKYFGANSHDAYKHYSNALAKKIKMGKHAGEREREGGGGEQERERKNKSDREHVDTWKHSWGCLKGI